MAKLAFLTRGDRQWGMGHLHRVSWLLAATCGLERPDLSCMVCCRDSLPARAFWSGRGAQVHYFDETHSGDTAELVAAMKLPAGSTAVLDWLDSPAELVIRLREAGIRTVLLDDYGPARHEADIVVNALLSQLDRALFKLGNACVFSGADYVQLPPEVTKLRNVASATLRVMEENLEGPPPPPGPVHCVLVSFGGNPRPALITLALRALNRCRFNGRVIVMPAPQTPPHVPDGLDVEFHPAGPDFHSLLAASDLALLGGGLSLYEAVHLGVPAVALAVRSETPGLERHQMDTIRKLEGAGCCRAVGMADAVSSAMVAAALNTLIEDPYLRGSISLAGRILIDGEGLLRTLELILPGTTIDCT